jgi:hypothetical protein
MKPGHEHIFQKNRFEFEYRSHREMKYQVFLTLVN